MADYQRQRTHALRMLGEIESCIQQMRDLMDKPVTLQGDRIGGEWAWYDKLIAALGHMQHACAHAYKGAVTVPV